jgi:hypothetical protein
MTTPNERRIRAGYDLFLAANPDRDEDWGADAPVAALIDHENIEWIDDDQQQPGRRSFNDIGDGRNRSEPSGVLGRLRELRAQMPCCQILSCVEDEQRMVVHTVDHALKDPNFNQNREISDRQLRPHFCASSFQFDEKGKVVGVHYCSGELPLDVPLPGLLGGSTS